MADFVPDDKAIKKGGGIHLLTDDKAGINVEASKFFYR
jgi:hypothetical protein